MHIKIFLGMPTKLVPHCKCNRVRSSKLFVLIAKLTMDKVTLDVCSVV